MSVIPGMGPEDKIDTSDPTSENATMIPGLDIDLTDDKNKLPIKKVRCLKKKKNMLKPAGIIVILITKPKLTCFVI